MDTFIKDRVGLSITTYEFDDKGNPSPTLTHVFWGQTVKDATSIAKSHLVTDYFFSGSFEGGIDWKGQFLQLDNEGEILTQQSYRTRADISKILNNLTKQAEKINDKKEELGIIQQIEMIST
jgi:hypothetical protein